MLFLGKKGGVPNKLRFEVAIFFSIDVIRLLRINAELISAVRFPKPFFTEGDR